MEAFSFPLLRTVEFSRTFLVAMGPQHFFQEFYDVFVDPHFLGLSLSLWAN